MSRKRRNRLSDVDLRKSKTLERIPLDPIVMRSSLQLWP
jgi:hypothetical protein